MYNMYNYIVNKCTYDFKITCLCTNVYKCIDGYYSPI